MKAKTLAMLAGVGLLAGTASANFLGVVWEEVDNEGYADATYDIFAQFDSGADFLAAVAGTPLPLGQLDWTVTGGTYYQAPFGGLTSPKDIFIGADPATAYDTFVTIGRYFWSDANPDPISTTAGLAFTATSLYSTNGAWYIPPTTPGGDPTPEGIPFEFAPGDYRVLVARLSVNADPGDLIEINGTATYQYFENGEAGSGIGTFIIPAPGVLALLGLAGLAGTRRRR